jgi:hypothetical protein
MCRYSWRVPDELNGRIRVLIEPVLGPFEWKFDPTWYDV